MKRWLALVGWLLVLGGGCSRGPDGTSPDLDRPPFLGVPEDRTRQIEEENPDIDSRLRGATTMTEVRTADYATYLRLKKEGRLAREEVRGGDVYFAVNEGRHAPLPGGGAGAAGGAYSTLVSRYKAAIPQGE
jgi:hypothetical protein